MKDPTEVKQIYDGISYKKGCCLLKMISNELTEKRFMEGVRYYLETYQYGSTVSNDLWTALEDISKLSMSKKMNIWTKDPGVSGYQS